MTDTAVWRLGNDHLVLRCRGSEHMLSWDEARNLLDHLNAVMIENRQESFGADYIELRQHTPAASDQYSASALTSIAEALGITAPEPKFRRI